MNLGNVVGIILKDGGPTSHAVIVAKNLGIPCVIGVGESIKEIQNEDIVALDGARGELTINPDKKALEEMNKTKKLEEEIRNNFIQTLYEEQDFEFLIKSLYKII